MDRRDLLKNVGAFAGVTAAGSALGQSFVGKSKKSADDLTSGLAECLAWCEKCVSHCTDMVLKGETMFAETLKRSRECVAVCDAMLVLSTFDAPHKVELARLCATVCRECAAECDLHAAHSEICRACAAACRKCADLCDSVG